MVLLNLDMVMDIKIKTSAQDLKNLGREARQALKGIAHPSALSETSDKEAIRWALETAEGRLTYGKVPKKLGKFYFKVLSRQI